MTATFADNKQMTKLLLPLALGFSVLAANAQTMKDPISASEKAVYLIVKGPVIRAAAKMSEADYAFKPTPEVRSFGELIGHIADGQYEFCAPVLGDKTEHASVEKGKTTKADLVQALNDAFAYCDTAYNKMTDSQGAEVIGFFGKKAAKISILSFNTAHTDEHYGNLVTYMRLKGVVPPSSEKKP